MHLFFQASFTSSSSSYSESDDSEDDADDHVFSRKDKKVIHNSSSAEDSETEICCELCYL
jgi:hypothetical protein